MVFTVVGREIREFKDDDASDREGRPVKVKFTVLHCVNDPKRIDAERVEGQQVQSFSFYPQNGLMKIANELPIPCIIKGDVSRNGRYVNLDDIEVVDN